MTRARETPEEKVLRLLRELKDSEARHRLQTEYWEPWSPTQKGPYAWQVEFHNAGSEFMERGLLAANQSGKSVGGGAETSCHLTGIYPPFWKGKRFDGPVNWLAGAPTNEMLRDAVQTQLFGGVDRENEVRELPGTGWVPKNAIGDFGFRQCGVCNVVDYCKVKHYDRRGTFDGWSTVGFRTYEQGAVKFQAVTLDGVWLDEEPEDYTIYGECRMRVMVRNGIIYITRTPLFGMTEVVMRFLDGAPGTWFKKVGWKDCPHLTPEKIAAMLAGTPEHERAARSEGEPLLGAGAVYPVSESDYVIDGLPNGIPKHFARITGIDFGFGHPAATIGLAYDRDTDVAYVYAEHKASGMTPITHVQQIRAMGDWIPVAWPHDGTQTGKADGIPLADHYRNEGAKLLSLSACHSDDVLGSQNREKSSQDILERLRSGRLKVFRHCFEIVRELRSIHRKGEPIPKIVPIHDDLESALRYAIMMLRYAMTPAEGDPNRKRPQRQEESYEPFAVLEHGPRRQTTYT